VCCKFGMLFILLWKKLLFVTSCIIRLKVVRVRFNLGAYVKAYSTVKLVDRTVNKKMGLSTSWWWSEPKRNLLVESHLISVVCVRRDQDLCQWQGPENQDAFHWPDQMLLQIAICQQNGNVWINEEIHYKSISNISLKLILTSSILAIYSLK
jgi:hypothetical protein